LDFWFENIPSGNPVQSPNKTRKQCQSIFITHGGIDFCQNCHRGCQIFLGATDQSGKNEAKLPQKMPNGFALYQNAQNVPNGREIEQNFRYQICIKIGVLVLKYTIWQPRLSPAVVMRSRAL
jgi:hypothetical protein